MTRLKKVVRVSISIELVLYLVIGATCYITFGEEYVTPLIILRKPLKEYVALEWVFKVLIILFFLFNTIGLPLFNVPLRDMLCRKIHSIRVQQETS